MGTIKKIFTALGTVNHIEAGFEESEREAAREALEKAEIYINDMDDRLSVFKPDSEISQINHSAGICDTLVGRDTFDLLALSKEYGSRTGGAFDITTKPLTEAGSDNADVDFRDIILNEMRLSVRLKHKRQGIHLGGIAKGYAVDRVASILKHHGITNASINLGGTVRNIGQSRKVGIRHPFDASKLAAVLESTDEAVVTSGLYERGNHIFDPSSGKPAQSDLAAVTVVGSDGAAADAAATACMVLGIRQSVEMLRSFGLEGLFFSRNGDIFATEKINSRIQIV